MKNNYEKFGEYPLDLMAILEKVRQKAALILAAMIVFACAGYGLSDKTAHYASSFSATVVSTEEPETGESLYYTFLVGKDFGGIIEKLFTGENFSQKVETCDESGILSDDMNHAISVSFNGVNGLITFTARAQNERVAHALAVNAARVAPAYLAETIPGCTLQVLSAPTDGVEQDTGVQKAGLFALLGGCIAVGCVVFAAIFQNTVNSCEALEMGFNLPVLGWIQNAECRKGQRNSKAFSEACLLKTDSAQVKKDAYYALQNNLLHALREGENCVGITGSSAGCGNSTSAANLALSLAQAGKHVLLVDADLRQNTLSQKLGFGACQGLAQLLAGNTDLEVVLRQFAEGLDVLPAGERCEDSTVLFSGEKMTRLMAQVKAQYDCVLVHLPSMEFAPDAAIVAGAIDGFLLTVRFDRSRTKQVWKTIRGLSLAEANILGFLCTDVPCKRTGKQLRNKAL